MVGRSMCAVALLASGCMNGLRIDDGGESTRGDRGRSELHLSDGLCPGWGACDLETRIAVGAAPEVVIDEIDASLDGLSVAATGGVTIDGVVLEPESERLDVDLTATSEGRATLHLLDRGGDEIDRSTVHVALPAAMDCGPVPTGMAALYDMPELVPASSVSIPLTLEGEERAQEILCQVRDAAGTPLLTVAAIEWRVVEGAEVLGVNDGGFEPPAPEAAGARIYLLPSAVGTARLEARFGELVSTVDVTIVE